MLIFTPCVARAQNDQDWKACNAEDANAALSACTRLIETEKVDPETRSTVLARRATAYWRKQDYDSAIADANSAIQLNPKNSEVYARRGACFLGKRDPERAFADINKAIEIDGRNFRAYSNRGLLHAQRRDFDRAIADAIWFYRALPRQPLARRTAQGGGQNDGSLPCAFLCRGMASVQE